MVENDGPDVRADQVGGDRHRRCCSNRVADQLVVGDAVKRMKTMDVTVEHVYFDRKGNLTVVYRKLKGRKRDGEMIVQNYAAWRPKRKRAATKKRSKT